MLETVTSHRTRAASAATGAALIRPRLRFGLAGRVLVLIITFVMLAEVAVYLPSIANFRTNWLKDRVSAAYTAALVFQAGPEEVPEALARAVLESASVNTIVLKFADTRRLLAATDMPPQIDDVYDLRSASLWQSIVAACATLLYPAGRVLRLVAEGPMGGEFMEVTLSETPLRAAMIAFSVRLLAVSLIISMIVAVLAALAIHLMILRPVRRLTSSIIDFGAAPEDASRMVQPSGAAHEIGVAEEALAEMQLALVTELTQKKRLAALGLAVAQINHDLRNMLAPAQLLSDRLGNVSDPLARSVAPKLVATLDRAIAFCQSTLEYGRIVERSPQIALHPLRPIVQDAIATAALSPALDVQIDNNVSSDLKIPVDAEQMFRVFLNLIRNAIDALEQAARSAQIPPRIVISAITEEAGTAILVSDNGPGVPEMVRAKLFEAFQGAGRPGGTGLGLSIAADLVRAHGGSISLVHQASTGASFRIFLPAR